MADEKTNQPSRADEYRKHAFEFATKIPQIWEAREDVAALWAIAAELAEANERDREAEIRANAAESFVAGVQAELAKQHIVIPGGAVQVKPPRGR
jgi:hypothetical protein